MAKVVQMLEGSCVVPQLQDILRWVLTFLIILLGQSRRWGPFPNHLLVIVMRTLHLLSYLVQDNRRHKLNMKEWLSRLGVEVDVF